MRDHIHFPARACLVLIQGPRVSPGANSRSIIPPVHPPALFSWKSAPAVSYVAEMKPKFAVETPPLCEWEGEDIGLAFKQLRRMSTVCDPESDGVASVRQMADGSK